jgi:hypothetical protein
MKTELKSKFFDGLLSAVIIMAVMYPLIIMFQYLERWGDTGYWAATILFMVAGIWLLYRSTLEKLSEIGRGWYGIVGGLCAWTTTELSHELDMINIENSDILIVLLLFIGFLDVMWKYFPAGAKFWIITFMMNWVGHVYIHVGEEFLGFLAMQTLFTLTAAAYGLSIIGVIYWIFARTTTRVQRLWGGLWIWHALAMLFFLIR